MKNLRLTLIALIFISGLIFFSPTVFQTSTEPDETTAFDSGKLKRARDFSNRWETSPATRPDLIEAAMKHRDSFLTLMEGAPDVALLKAISLSDYAALPQELRPFFEEPFSAIGTTDLLWAVSMDADQKRHCTSSNTLTIGETKLTAFSSDGGILPVLKDVPLTGIRLGNKAVISALPTLGLSSNDLAAAQELYPLSEQGTRDPMTRNEGRADATALIGGTLYHFESPEHLAAVNDTLTQAIETAEKERTRTLSHPFDWLAGSSGGDIPSEITDATPYQEEQIDVLFIRVDFSDFPGEPVTKAALETTLATVNGHLSNNSYGNAGITYTVSNSVYRMPSTGASYAVSYDNAGIQTDARNLASANYTIANYDVIAVYFPDLGGVAGSQIDYGGLASIGGANHWINGANSVGVILHEFGHNYGLHHANYHHPEQELSGSYQVAGSLEYGDIFDEMGSGSSPEAHFSHLAKNYMKWMPDSKVTEATTDATYTIYRFDHANADANALLAVKVPMSGDVNYWLGYRQLFTSSSYNLETAAYVVAENLANSRETSLIDMTPESQASETEDRRDAGLEVGSTFYEPNAGVRFNALARGGSEPNQWIQVQVLFDPRISIASTAVSVDEQCGIATITVQRRFSSTGAVSIDYATSNGSALSGADYYATSGTLTWADGELSDKTITISIRPDVISEGSETFTLNLSSVIGGKLDPGAAVATISILDAGQRMIDFAPGFFNTTVDAIIPLADGKIIIGGNISSGIGNAASIRHIARLNADGSVDTSFVTGTGFNAPVETLTLQDDGKILVGGDFTSYNGTACNHLARLNSDGNLDTSFVTANGTGTDGLVRAIAVEASGKILVGGSFTTFDGISEMGLTRLNANGTRDTATPLTLPFNAGFGTDIYAILAESSGKIVTAGSFYIGWTGAGFRSGLARLNTDGTRDTSFDPDAGAHGSGSNNSLRRIYALAGQPDGKYLITGPFTAYDENNTDYVARINNDGSFDNTFTVPSFNGSGRVILNQASGDTVIGGSFTSPTNRLERLTTNGIADATFNQGSGPGGPIYALAGDDTGAIWVGGNFFSYNGSSSRPIVKIAGGVSPYDLWVQTRFSSAEISSGDSAANQDPDGDGLVNLVEMAMGTNPTVQNSEPVFSTASNGGITLYQNGGQDYLQISLDRSAIPKGAWFAAQFSSNLTTWSPVNPTPGTQASYDIIEDTETRFTVRDKTPITTSTPRFGRISVIIPE